MKITDQIAQHLLDVHYGNNWTEVNIAQTLQNIHLKEALTVTASSPNTLASLLNHISYWNRVMISRIEGFEIQIPASNGFDHPTLHDENDWIDLQNQNLISARDLAAAIREINDDDLFNPILPGYPSYYKSLHGAIEHVHYHLGQMVIIKNLVLRVTANASFID